MRRRSRPSIIRHPIVATLPCLLVVLAACGSDAKSSGTTVAPATTAAATAAAPATTASAVTTAAPAATTAAPATTAASATTAAAATGTGTAAAAAGTPVAVSEKEFSIDLAPTSLAAGTYTFNVANAGQFKHNLVIEGNGVDATSDTFTGGQSGALTVKLAPGTYDVYCSIPTHKAKGMDLTITVT
jgi:plastocyanin